MKAFLPLYVASLREFVRDRSALFWTIAFPVMFILIFGAVFSGSEDISFSIGLVNEDGPGGAQLVEGFEAIEAFDLSTGERADELEELESGGRSAVIVIPEGTGEALGQALGSRGDDPVPGARLEVYYDPANQNTSQIVINIIDQIIASMNEEITGVSPALAFEAREVTTDANLRMIDYMLPGVLGMSLMQLGLMATAGPLVSLREKGVLRRMGATPLSRTTLLASQLAFRLTIAILSSVLLIAIGMAVFNVEVKMSNLLAIIGVILFGSATFVTLGYFMSALAKSEEAVEGLVSLPYFIFMFLSGIFWPLDFMPNWIRPLVDVIPLTYLGDLLRKVMIDAGTYFSVTRSVVTLAAWLVISAILAIRFFRWEPQG